MKQSNIKVGDYFVFNNKLYIVESIVDNKILFGIHINCTRCRLHGDLVDFKLIEDKNVLTYGILSEKYKPISKSDAYKFLLKQFDDKIAKLKDEKLHLALKFFN